MNEKLTIQELIAELAIKQNIGQADAEAFVCSFFALIEDGLKRDKYVRIKGFGTFKLIDTDLNDGRVVFVPETSVRDAVNKPFAHFQPVELKEGIHFGDVEEELAHVQRKDTVTANDEKNESDIVDKKHVPDVDKGCESSECVVSEDDFNNDTEKNDVCKVSEVQTKRKFAPWYIPVAILFVGIVIGCGIMWGVFSDNVKSGSKLMGDVKSGSKLMGDIAVSGYIDSVLVDSAYLGDDDSLVAVKQDTTAVHKKTIDSIINAATEDRKEIEYLSDEVPYKISGTIETFTIVKGSTLSKVAYRYYKNRKLWPKVAYRYYKNRKLWPYIVMHNKHVIQDPNNVPIGTVLRIPELTPVE